MTDKPRFYQSPFERLPRVCVLDEGDHIHYTASPEDIFAVLELLPDDAVSGIPVIILRLEAGQSANSADGEVLEFPPTRPDPYTGRLGIEILPGVFTSPVAGSIHRLTRHVTLTADVYDPAISDRQMWELFLRLRKLSALVHEIGHNVHFAALEHSRDIDRPTAEQEAEMLAYEWTQDIVIPYLRVRHADSVGLLEDWASTWAGHPVALGDLVDEPRALPDDPSFLAPWRLAPGWLIIPHLAYAVAEGRSREQTREWFAGYLELWGLDR